MQMLQEERAEIQWCTLCGGRFTAEECSGAYACPSCGSTGVPCATEEDVVVEVNWHELRILGIWAENWARQHANSDGGKRMPATVAAICRRLQVQCPSLTPLTLSQEVAELPRELEKRGIAIGKVESNIDKPKPLPVNGNGAIGKSRRSTGVSEQIKHMVDRFLGWRLPKDFNPDAGISFEPEFNKEWMAKQGKPPMRHEPVGTNLFDATQAEAMVRYMLEGMPPK